MPSIEKTGTHWVQNVDIDLIGVRPKEEARSAPIMTLAPWAELYAAINAPPGMAGDNLVLYIEGQRVVQPIAAVALPPDGGWSYGNFTIPIALPAGQWSIGAINQSANRPVLGGRVSIMTKLSAVDAVKSMGLEFRRELEEAGLLP